MPQTNITITNNLKLLLQSIALMLLLLSLWTIFSPTKASAATITVGGACTLDDAVASMNTASDQSGCSGVGAYGTDDTVTLPAGTYPYANSDTVQVPLVVQGAGMGETIIDCGGNNEGLIFDNPGVNPMAAVVQDLSILNPDESVASGSAAVNSTDFAMTIRRVEIYSDTAQEVDGAIGVVHELVDNQPSLIEDVYIHDATFSYGAVAVFAREGGVSLDNTIRRITISNVVGTNNTGVNLVTFATYDNGGTMSGIIENATFIGNTPSVASNIVYIAGIADSTFNGGDGVVDVLARNITAVGEDLPGVSSAGLVAVALALDGGSASTDIEVQNFLGVNTDGVGGIYAPDLGGTESASLTSLGGNIIDGAYSAELSHPSDQDTVVGLADTLGPLQDNGGLTPTIALLPGSPAIDAGISNSLSDDQIGTARPQGLAYDSGAFEYVTPDEVDEEGEDGQGANGDGTEDAGSAGNELADTGQPVLILQLLALSVLTLLTARYYSPLYAKISTRIKK